MTGDIMLGYLTTSISFIVPPRGLKLFYIAPPLFAGTPEKR
jgi:hypothetical protein